MEQKLSPTEQQIWNMIQYHKSQNPGMTSAQAFEALASSRNKSFLYFGALWGIEQKANEGKNGIRTF